MKQIFDIALGFFVAAPGSLSPLKSLYFKRGDTSTQQIAFARLGVGEVIEDATNLHFLIKDEVDGELLAHAFGEDWTHEDGVWAAPLNTDTDPMTTWLGGALTKKALVEFTFTSPATGVCSTRIIPATIENDLYREGDGTPLELPEPLGWLDDHGLRIDADQALSGPEKEQGLENLGILSRLIPPGGTYGQSLTKSAHTDFALTWSTVSGGGGGLSVTDVATNADKLAMMPLGSVLVRVTGEGNRIELFSGSPLDPSTEEGWTVLHNSYELYAYNPTGDELTVGGVTVPADSTWVYIGWASNLGVEVTSTGPYTGLVDFYNYDERATEGTLAKILKVISDPALYPVGMDPVVFFQTITVQPRGVLYVIFK